MMVDLFKYWNVDGSLEDDCEIRHKLNTNSELRSLVGEMLVRDLLDGRISVEVVDE